MKILVPKDMGGSAVPAGVYKATITNYKRKSSENSGNSYLQLEFTLSSQGPDASVKTVGRKVFSNLTLTSESLWRSDIALKAVGFKQGLTPLQDKEVTEEELINFLTTKLIGKPLVIVVVHREYQGQTRVDVAEMKPLGASEGAAQSEEKAPAPPRRRK